MRPFLIVLFALLPLAATAADRPLALVGGTLLDGYPSAPVHDAVVVVEGDRIVAAGPAHRTPVPADARVIDIAGRTVLPGLIDAHVHVDLIGHGDYDRYYSFTRGTERLDEVMPIAARQMLRAGVTSAIDLGTPLEILDLRARIEAGEIPGPRLQVSGPWITRVYLDGLPASYQKLIASPREAARATRELIDAGVDVIKVWVGLTPEDYAAVVETAHAANLKVHAHLYHPDAIRAALDAGVDVLQHMGSARNPPYDEALVSEVAHSGRPVVQTISHRIWVHPYTEAFPGRLRDPVLAADMPADVYAELQASFEHWQRLSYFHDIALETRNAARSAHQFVEAGAFLGVGTDAASPLNFHHEAIWHELRALVEVGMTPAEAITAATFHNARIMGREDDLGTVEAGKLADLLVVRGNPLVDIDAIADVEFVVADGVPWYAGPTEDAVLQAIGRRF
jgi:imidazolonepropionase-like amidohydrolase